MPCRPHHPQTHPLPWKEGPSFYHTLLQSQSHSFYLSSNDYAYVGAYPHLIATWHRSGVKIRSENKIQSFSQNPFDWFSSLERKGVKPKAQNHFCSGWVGYLTYEAAPLADEALPSRLENDEEVLGWWGLYDPVIVFDLSKKQALIASWGLNENFQADENRARERIAKILKLIEETAPPLAPSSLELQCFTKPESNFTKEDYLRAVQNILNYISAGDCYQVNFTQQIKVQLNPAINPFELFWRLIKNFPAPYAAYLDCGYSQILSFSPELFLSVKDQHLITRPIKGSMARGKDQIEDLKNAQTLLSSSKENAELLMITDLERNDFGKICKTGSVYVSALKKLETYGYIHHLVSTVQGILKDGLGVFDAIRALFPGGSITGAPKQRSMEIIRELETKPRGVYTGILGFVDFSPLSVLNIAIRTLEIRDKKATWGAGGGITTGSDPILEYEESLTKSPLFKIQ